MGYQDGRWMEPTQVSVQWWAVVLVILNFRILLLDQWFPKCGERPPGWAQEILKRGRKRCAEKKKRNFHLAIFSEIYLPYIYHSVLITNLITL
jgi:hypothetical protein